MKSLLSMLLLLVSAFPAWGFVVTPFAVRPPTLRSSPESSFHDNLVALSSFPEDLKGNTIHRPDHGGAWNDDYHPYAYQYATTSNPAGHWEPNMIVYVEKDEKHSDIKTAIEYARNNQLSIATRSGGHQYLGFSSTSGRNIQLDMSNYTHWEIDNEKDPTSLTLDVGLKLKQITEICSKYKVFFPHGECTHVALGGHVQTGGYTVFSRSLGMMIDFVEWFEIITADGLVRKVTKPSSKITETEGDNDDLWFGVLGGSPGNYGVLTRVNIRLLQDKDHPTKAMFVMLPFTKECLKETLDIMAEVNDNPNIAADYNYNVMTFSKGSIHKYDIDEEMRNNFGTQYGVDMEDEKWNIHFGELEQGLLPAMVIVTAAYIGVQEKNVTLADEWLASIDSRITPYKSKPFHAQFLLFSALNDFFGLKDYKTNTPMSEVNDRCVWRWVREFDLPFNKRVFAGTSISLQEQGFAEWATEKCWDINTEGTKNGCHLSSQFIAYCGNNNKVAENKNPTALGHRIDGVNSCAFDFFYENDEAFKWGNNWLDSGEDSVVKAGFGENGKYSKDDLRFLYAPWGDNETAWGQNTNLDDMWQYYFDDEEVYNRLLVTKRRLDPNHVFTPNPFCVGYNDMLKERGESREGRTVYSDMKRPKDWEVIGKTYDPLRETGPKSGD